MSRKIHFETLGCKLNQVESEGAARFFADSGFEVTMEPLTASGTPDADVVLCVVNTCTVTTKAEQKARRIIRMLLNVCPKAAIAVTGCYAQLTQEQILDIDKRLCVLGGQHKGAMADVPEILKKFISENPDSTSEAVAAEIQKFFDKKNASGLQNIITEPFRLSTDTFLNHSRSSLKIQDGCNCVCTYCAIRLARGKAVSLDANEVVSRVQALEKAGQNEVVITTVNIAQYRGKFSKKELSVDPDFVKLDENDEATVDFAGVLSLILKNTEKIGIRISSLYPEIVDEHLAKLISDERVRPHFHISVQSGSDAVLAKMKRPYKIEAVYKACELLKKYKKNPFLACDIIAGFPGETDADFELTMKMLRECGFTFVHAFPFSARPGTEAYKMRPMVPNNITDVRIKKLEEFNRKEKTAYILSYSAQVLPAVCETIHRARIMKDRIIVHAVTENFLHCQLNFNPDDPRVPKAGSVVNVKIRRPLEPGEKTGESDTLAELSE